MLRLPSDPRLERELESRVASRLAGIRALEDDLDDLWAAACETRPPSLGVAEFVLFRVLHRQFKGAGVPGLRQAVRAARFLWGRVRRSR